MELELAIGMDPEEVDLDGERGSIEDNESMKSVTGWNNLSCADGNGTNKSGFNALPAGHRYPFGSFDNMGDLAMFWTSSPIIEGYTAWRRRLPRVGFVERELAQVSEGLSVRCVKD